MNPLTRWLKFNAVGVLGMALQLTLLALFNHAAPRHYLAATAFAIELTLLHNFAWHLHYTFRDRREETSRLQQLLRFHLSNGAVSLLGNLVLMRLLVKGAHMHVLPANIAAIICCSLVNFWLGNTWAFAYGTQDSSLTLIRDRRFLCTLALLLLAFTTLGARHSCAQSANKPHEVDYSADCAYGNVFVGPAASVSGDANRLTGTAGVTIGQYFARVAGKGIAASPQFELGVIGPPPGGYRLDGLFSFNEMLAVKVPRRPLYPFAVGGYTRMFATGNAVNFGVGLDFGRRSADRVLRVELRDYYLFTGPQQHVVGLRFAWGKFIAD